MDQTLPDIYERVRGGEARCHYCGLAAQAVDHVIARSRGGSNDPDNLVPSCNRCNDAKNTSTIEEFYARGLVSISFYRRHQLCGQCGVVPGELCRSPSGKPMRYQFHRCRGRADRVVGVTVDRPLFAMVPEDLITDAGVSDRAIRLYALLDRYAGEKATAWPSYAELVARLEWSTDKTIRVVAELEATGYLEVDRRAGGNNRYRLRLRPRAPVDKAGERGSRKSAAPRGTAAQVAANLRPGTRGHDRETAFASSGSAAPPGQPLDPMTRTQQAQRAIMEENMARMAAEEPPLPPEDRKRMAAEVREANRQKLGR